MSTIFLNRTLNDLSIFFCLRFLSSFLQLEQNFDFVYFSAGLIDCDDDSISNLTEFTGSVESGVTFEAGNVLSMRFTSDGSVTRRGFDIRVTAEAEGGCCSGMWL